MIIYFRRIEQYCIDYRFSCKAAIFEKVMEFTLDGQAFSFIIYY